MRVLIPVRGAQGHIRPMVPLALALRDAGHEVRFACREAMTPIVASAGLVGVTARTIIAGNDVAGVLGVCTDAVGCGARVD